MVLANQPLHIHGAPTHLLPVYVADQRLVARIFLAHAASLRYMIFFARHKFGGFLHSFNRRLRHPAVHPEPSKDGHPPRIQEVSRFIWNRRKPSLSLESLAWWGFCSQLLCSGAGSIARIVEPGGPAGCCQPFRSLKRTQAAKKVSNIKFPVGRKGYASR